MHTSLVFELRRINGKGRGSLYPQPSWQFKCRACKRQLALKHKAEKRHNTAGRLAGKSCSWTSLGSSASSCGCYWCIACGVCLEKPPKTVGLRSSKFKSENGTKETKDRCAVRSAGRSAVVRGLCAVLGSPNGEVRYSAPGTTHDPPDSPGWLNDLPGFWLAICPVLCRCGHRAHGGHTVS